RDDDVLTALAGDLRLGDARGVDALPDHLDRLVDVAGGQLTATLDLWLQDDLGAALEVERQVRRPGRVGPAHAGGEGAEHHGHERDEERQGAPRAHDGRRVTWGH